MYSYVVLRKTLGLERCRKIHDKHGILLDDEILHNTKLLENTRGERTKENCARTIFLKCQITSLAYQIMFFSNIYNNYPFVVFTFFSTFTRGYGTYVCIYVILRSLREEAKNGGPCKVVVYFVAAVAVVTAVRPAIAAAVWPAAAAVWPAVAAVVVVVGSLARRWLRRGVHILGPLHLGLVLLFPLHPSGKISKQIS